MKKWLVVAAIILAAAIGIGIWLIVDTPKTTKANDTHIFVIKQPDGDYVFDDDANLRKQTEQAVLELNRGSHMRYELLARYDTLQEEIQKEYAPIQNLLSVDVRTPEGAYIFSGYPTDESPYCLSSVTLQEEEYDILGISVGNTLYEAHETLLALGYEEKAQGIYEKYDVSITLVTDPQQELPVVGEVSASVKTYYLGNRFL
jgi:hypothetical protein